ncbi:E3 SUMO-protein ligase KIAA1586-like, partial [Aphis craccivora]
MKIDIADKPHTEIDVQTCTTTTTNDSNILEHVSPVTSVTDNRVVVPLRAFSFCTNGDMTDTMDENEHQYLTPHSHYDFLQCIVESHRSSFVEEILNDSFALSLRCNGSVDRTQIDKMYVLIKSISLKGEEKLYFLGAAEPIERGAKGLWTLTTNLKRTLCENEVMSPLITLWCVTHRSNLAWESVSSSVPEVNLLYQQQLQSDDLNIISMEERTKKFINKIETLKSNSLIGG